MSLTTKTDTSIIQNQQKTRDEQALRRASHTQALARVKDAIRAGYDSRITSMEFQDERDNRELQTGRALVQHHVPRDVAERPNQILTREFSMGGHLHPQTNSAPQTPFGLPSPLLDPGLQGPLSGISLPVEGVSSTFIGHGGTTHQVFVTAAGQTIVSPIPALSPAFPGSDSLLGATAHYESRETQMQLPTVVDSSVICEANTLESFPPVEPRPASTMPYVRPGPYLYPQPPYPYGPHTNLPPFHSLPALDSKTHQNNSDTNYDQGPPQGLYGPQQSRGGGQFNDSYSHKHNNGQRDNQGHITGTWNGGRRKGSIDYSNRSSRGGAGAGGGGVGTRGELQVFRGQMGRPNGPPGNRSRAGPNPMDHSSAQYRGPSPQTGTGLALPPQQNAQYALTTQPHMHHFGYANMMPAGQFPPPAYGYGMQQHYPQPGQDWRSFAGVNTNLMTETDAILLNRQRFGKGNVQNPVPKVTSEKSQPSITIPMTATGAPKPAGKVQNSIVVRKKKGNDPLQVRDVQTALDVTVTDPDLTRNTKNGAKKAPVTKFPGRLTFGTAPHIKPMNLREPVDNAASAATSKRKALRRGNEETVKSEAEQGPAAK